MFGILIGERVVDGKICVWRFSASNKIQGRQIVNTILFCESMGTNGEIIQFSPAGNSWKAVSIWLTVNEVESLIEKADKNKIVEIKRKRPLIWDAIYLIRLQKERQQK